VFHALSRDNMREIVGILLGQVKERLRAQSIHIDITPEAVELLIEKGFDPSLGARPLKRALQRNLEDPLAEFILRGQLVGGGRVRIHREAEDLKFEPAATGTAEGAPAPEPAVERAS
jgi:ATP-dependent Clp protease ATP-binding subunit ClpC